MIFGKVVAKNRAFGNNFIFLKQFFNFGGGGGGVLCVPLGGAYGFYIRMLEYSCTLEYSGQLWCPIKGIEKPQRGSTCSWEISIGSLNTVQITTSLQGGVVNDPL